MHNGSLHMEPRMCVTAHSGLLRNLSLIKLTDTMFLSSLLSLQSGPSLKEFQITSINLCSSTSIESCNRISFKKRHPFISRPLLQVKIKQSNSLGCFLAVYLQVSQTTFQRGISGVHRLADLVNRPTELQGTHWFPFFSLIYFRYVVGLQTHLNLSLEKVSESAF